MSVNEEPPSAHKYFHRPQIRHEEFEMSCCPILILPVLNIFQRLGDVAPGLAVGLEEAKEVLGYVFDPSELLLPFVDVHLDSLKGGEHF